MPEIVSENADTFVAQWDSTGKVNAIPRLSSLRRRNILSIIHNGQKMDTRKVGKKVEKKGMGGREGKPPRRKATENKSGL